MFNLLTGIYSLLFWGSSVFGAIAFLLAAFFFARKFPENKWVWWCAGFALGILNIVCRYLSRVMYLSLGWGKYGFGIWLFLSLVSLIVALVIPDPSKFRKPAKVDLPMPFPPGTRDWSDK